MKEWLVELQGHSLRLVNKYTRPTALSLKFYCLKLTASEPKVVGTSVLKNKLEADYTTTTKEADHLWIMFYFEITINCL